MAPPYAFVTLLTSDSYLPGALTIAAALKDLHTSPPVHPEVDFHSVCLVAPEYVDVSTIKLLRRAFNVVIGVEIIAPEDDTKLKLLGMPIRSSLLAIGRKGHDVSNLSIWSTRIPHSWSL